MARVFKKVEAARVLKEAEAAGRREVLASLGN